MSGGPCAEAVESMARLDGARDDHCGATRCSNLLTGILNQQMSMLGAAVLGNGLAHDHDASSFGGAVRNDG